MAVVAALGAACHDSDSAVAADPPKIELKAAVAPLEGITVSSPIDGEVTQVQTSEGAVVHQGDALVVLANPGVDRDVAYARAAVASAEAKVRNAHASPKVRSDESERSAAAIVTAKQAKVERLRALLSTGDVAKQEVQDAETELAGARRDWIAERERLAGGAAPLTDPALLEAELDRARADLTFAEHRRALLTIKAPASGTIAKLHVHPGDEIYTRDALAQIVDASTVTVQATLAPELVRYVHAGGTAEVKLMTIPPRRFREPITRVAPPGTEGGPSVSVNVPNPDRMLQPGTPAVITVQ
jgi:membrane fusion protein (multidrug efflux system)